jgi:hypothetical protein
MNTALVYAHRDPNGTLVTNGCIGTRPLDDARMDLFDLGPSTITLHPAPAQHGSQWAFLVALSVLVLPLIILLARRKHHLRQP